MDKLCGTLLKSRKTRHEDTCVEDREPYPSDSEPVLYKGYDISMLPKEAHPDQTKDNKGLHRWTEFLSEENVFF